MIRATILALLFATGAQAATITESAAPTGPNWSSIAIGLDAVTSSGPRGTGQSVTGSGYSPVIKGTTSAAPYGRFAADGGQWIDSQDLKKTVLTLDLLKPAKAFALHISDAHDQRNSFFEIASGGATWSIASREANGTGHWLRILLDRAERFVSVSFSTAHNDGFGIDRAAGVCRK